MAKETTPRVEANRGGNLDLGLSLDARSLLAKQSEAVARVAKARGEYEQVKAELYRMKVDPRRIYIGHW